MGTPAKKYALILLMVVIGQTAPSGNTADTNRAKGSAKDSAAAAKEVQRTQKDMDILLGIKGRKKEGQPKKEAPKINEYDKNEPESPPFSVNTIDGKRRKFSARANNETFATLFDTYYTLYGNGRLMAAVYRVDTLTKKDSLIKTLAVQDKIKGQHYISWDGTDERGTRLNGYFECRIIFKHMTDDSSGRDTLFSYPIKATQ